MEISELYQFFLRHRRVSTDSRKISRGCIFFALKGDNFNGNNFAVEAVEKGAALAVVDEADLPNDRRIMKVGHVLDTLQQLATWHRKKLGIPILAITGSNGKTTTKELIKAVLSEKFNVLATEGNLNNHIGVPLTLLSMDESTEIGIVEMGANHPGEISQLAKITLPDYGMITNIGKAHLEGFGTIEGVTKAKGELFHHLADNEKLIFLNEGNEWIKKLIPENYGYIQKYNGLHGIHAVKSESNPYLKLELDYKNEPVMIQTRLIGGYNTENVIAACSIGIYFGIGNKEIQRAIEAYQPANNRSQLIKTEHNTILMDAYNANPSSMTAAVKEFIDLSEKRKLLILGEMRELGNTSGSEHTALISYIKQQGISNVICTGNLFKRAAEQAGYRFAESVDDVISLLTSEKPQGYTVFIKGSRSNQLEKVLPFL